MELIFERVGLRINIHEESPKGKQKDRREKVLMPSFYAFQKQEALKSIIIILKGNVLSSKNVLYSTGLYKKRCN